MSERPSATLDAMVDAAIAFSERLTYLRHPKVRDYLGTENGDSPEKWERDYFAALCKAILAAAPSAVSETAPKSFERTFVEAFAREEALEEAATAIERGLYEADEAFLEKRGDEERVPYEAGQNAIKACVKTIRHLKKSSAPSAIEEKTEAYYRDAGALRPTCTCNDHDDPRKCPVHPE